MRISSFKVHRIECSLDRDIGDNACSYRAMTIVAVALTTSDGLTGWGYSQAMTSGNFSRPAWWVKQVPAPGELAAVFNQYWWPMLNGRAPADTAEVRKTVNSGELSLDRAVRLALWDIASADAGMPLFVYIGGNPAQATQQAYGSPLDFPLDDASTVRLVNKMVGKGLTNIKVKVGAADPNRDISRLKLVQSVAPDQIRLSADANEAWTSKVALERLEQFDAAGISLEYLEDPLPSTDLEGLSALCKSSPITIAGHDYVRDIEQMRRLVEAGLGRLRTNMDYDYMLDCEALAAKHSLPIAIGNSQFEVSVHAAVALPHVDRIEFSDLSWNDLVTDPVLFANGVAQAPERNGHGLRLKNSVLSHSASAALS